MKLTGGVLIDMYGKTGSHDGVAFTASDFSRG